MIILYPKITHKEWFLLSLKTIQKYMKNINNIYILKTDVDLSTIPNIIVTNQSLYLFCSREDIDLLILVIDLNVCCLTNTNPEYLPITYTIQDGRYIQDHIKPQIILKSKYLELSNLLFLYPLSLYFKHIDRIGLPDSSFTVVVNKPICCTIKQVLLIKNFAIFNQKSFSSMKKYIEDKLSSLL